MFKPYIMPTFRVVSKGILHKHIKNAFLRSITVSKDMFPLKEFSVAGRIYKIILDTRIEPAEGDKVVISFQHWYDGSNYAIVRFDDETQRNKPSRLAENLVKMENKQ